MTSINPAKLSSVLNSLRLLTHFMPEASDAQLSTLLYLTEQRALVQLGHSVLGCEALLEHKGPAAYFRTGSDRLDSVALSLAREAQANLSLPPDLSHLSVKQVNLLTSVPSELPLHLLERVTFSATEHHGENRGITLPDIARHFLDQDSAAAVIEQLT